jgi:hypothetical protein
VWAPGSVVTWTVTPPPLEECEPVNVLVFYTQFSVEHVLDASL